MAVIESQSTKTQRSRSRSGGLEKQHRFAHLKLATGMAFLSDVSYLNRGVSVYSHVYFCKAPMVRLNIKAAGNSDGHWFFRDARGLEGASCSIPTPNFNPDRWLQSEYPIQSSPWVGALSEDPSP